MLPDCRSGRPAGPTNTMMIGGSGVGRKQEAGSRGAGSREAPAWQRLCKLFFDRNSLAFHKCLGVSAALWEEKVKSTPGIRPFTHRHNELWPAVGGAALARGPNTSSQVDQVGPVQPVGKISR